MPWWGWILVGAILLGSELFVTSEFYLVFLGVAAVAVGLTGMVFDLAEWQQWLSFGLLSVVFLVGFRRRFRNWVASSDGAVRDRVIGELATVSERIEPGGTGRAEMRGAVWTARNVGDTPLEAGDRVPTVEVDGLTLEVRRDA
jgi:membrane protein implicated in regulation of membrane protease activity